MGSEVEDGSTAHEGQDEMANDDVLQNNKICPRRMVKSWNSSFHCDHIYG